ncbi:MAG TPA: type II toxin-antitoxin system VapC family toxin [Vicinamibacterales bacterium]|nr:type II toxin-antitoxin system VapC family toxin [Vicinamibacterales bacterium]
MIAPLLDTHAWIWWMDGNRRLDARVVAKLDALDESHRPSLSAISLWEVAMLVSLDRLDLRPSFDAWLARAADAKTVRILPITAEIAMDLARLPQTLRRDPADRIIVSTGRVHQLPVLTVDRAMIDSKLVRTWRA